METQKLHTRKIIQSQISIRMTTSCLCPRQLPQMHSRIILIKVLIEISKIFLLVPLINNEMRVHSFNGLISLINKLLILKEINKSIYNIYYHRISLLFQKRIDNQIQKLKQMKMQIHKLLLDKAKLFCMAQTLQLTKTIMIKIKELQNTKL